MNVLGTEVSETRSIYELTYNIAEEGCDWRGEGFEGEVCYYDKYESNPCSFNEESGENENLGDITLFSTTAALLFLLDL